MIRAPWCDTCQAFHSVARPDPIQLRETAGERARSDELVRRADRVIRFLVSSGLAVFGVFLVIRTRDLGVTVLALILIVCAIGIANIDPEP